MILNTNLTEDNSPLINQPQSLHNQSVTITTEFEKESMDHATKEKYDNLQQTYQMFEWVYMACILFFQLAFISLFLNYLLDLTKSLVMLFAFATILALIVLCNIYVKLKVMLDMIKDTKNQHISVGIIVSYICINLGGASCLIYIGLLSVKLYDDSFMTWSIISVPIYFTVCILILYSLFLLPVMILNKQWFDICLIFNTLLCLLVFLILLNSKLDSNSNDISWTILSIPAHFGLTFYLAYISINYFYMTIQERRQQTLNVTLQLLSIILFINAVAFCTNQLNTIGQLDFIPSVILLLGSLCFSSEKLIGLYAVEEDESESSNSDKKQ